MVHEIDHGGALSGGDQDELNRQDVGELVARVVELGLAALQDEAHLLAGVQRGLAHGTLQARTQGGERYQPHRQELFVPRTPMGTDVPDVWAAMRDRASSAVQPSGSFHSRRMP